MTDKADHTAPSQGIDHFAEFDALFQGIVVPSTITKPTSSKKKDDSIGGMRMDKIRKIEDWIKGRESDAPRITGKGARGNLSSLAADPNYVSLKLSHGPAGNMKLYFKGDWKADHIIPASIEIRFWKATIKLFETGRYDAELEDMKKKAKAAFWDEHGNRNPPKVKNKKGKPTAEINNYPTTDEIVIG